MRIATTTLALLLVGGSVGVSGTLTDDEVRNVIAPHIQRFSSIEGTGGVAAAIHLEGRTTFIDYGLHNASSKRQITSDSLFALGSVRKVFEATLLAQAILRGEMKFDDPVSRYVVELQRGGYVRNVTLGQLASHTSGLLLRADYPPRPERGIPLADFLHSLNTWMPTASEEPGKQQVYAHSGFVLLQLALERRYGRSIGELIEQRVLDPLGMTSTILPEQDTPRSRALMLRAVQGYSKNGEPIGSPGAQHGPYEFPGTGQMFSSTRDLARFVAASLGELPIDPMLREALKLTHKGIFRISAETTQAMAWEVNTFGGPVIIDKPGGVENFSTYMALVPERKIGLVILTSRGYQHPYEVGRQTILPALAR